MASITIDPAENAVPFIGAKAIGTVIQISTTDSDVDDVIAAGFDRVVIERSTDGELTWAEVSTPPTRPALVKGQPSYVFRDTAGSETYHYRVRYLSTTRGELSTPSASVQGAGLAIRNLLTVQELKARYLFGVDLTNDAGEELSDAAFEHYILAAVRSVERWLDVPILPTSFVERQDYHLQDFTEFMFLQLDYYPVIEITEFNVKYTSAENLISYPLEWLRLEHDSGQLQIVPQSGNLSQVLIGQSGQFLSTLYSGRYRFPQLYEVHYSAGFQTGRVPRDILDVIGMLASFGPFNIFGDLIAGAGIANYSLSMDGLSQSIGTTASATNAGYGARLIQYEKQIKQQMPRIRDYYKRVGRMIVA